MSTAPPHLIGLDWGTSSLRAFLLADGRVQDSRQSADGVQRLTGAPDAFERAFDALTAEWTAQWPALPVVACGMVGSAQGWREVPYARTPADARVLARDAATLVTRSGRTIVLAPGVMHALPGATPDVMRGEETQVFGALQHEPAWAAAATFVLPGTHSKWVTVRDGRIEALATFMTGELYAVLRAHSILGRLMPPEAAAAEAGFERGVAQAQTLAKAGDLLHALFATRTLGLTGGLPHDALADFLSGLLIGSELLAARRDGPHPLVLVGEPALCHRYARAMAALGQPAPAALLANTAPAGLWALARAAGLLEHAQ